MSALVDIWTNELAKLRDNSKAADGTGAGAAQSIGSSQANHQVVYEEEKGKWSSIVRFIRRPFQLHYSEASVSMIVDCFSS